MYTLTNASGTRATIIETGGTLVALEFRDAFGRLDDVLLGLDSETAYDAEHPYFGSLVGRYANRIRGGRFRIGDRECRVACNDGPNHLHGGPGGFHARKWRAAQQSEQRLSLSCISPDGEEGYPGRLEVSVTYTLTQDDDLVIDYAAATDAPTVVNLTNHAYFNLAGQRATDVLDHVVAIEAARFTPVDSTLIPTGEVRPVAGTALDFTVPVAIGARIGSGDEQLRLAGGYDHNYVLDRSTPGTPSLAARVVEPTSRRVLEVWTTEPAIQFYSGNHLAGVVGKAGRRYARHAGFCLEAQHYPDSPNQPTFPSTLLEPGRTYRQTTIYRLRREE